MSVSKAIRSDSLAVYHRLMGVVHRVARECSLHQTEGLTRYTASRFLDVAERNRRKYLKMREHGLTSQQSRRWQQQKKKKKNQRGQALDAEYERFIAKELSHVHELMDRLLLAPGNRALTSILQVLSAGVGNTHYQRAMEQNYFRYCQFEDKRAERNEVEEEATAERQNRIMQHALIPYAERLLFLHRLADDKVDSDTSSGGRGHGILTPRQVVEAIIGTRSGVSAHHMSHGREDVVVEVDETFNKQIIYVRCEAYDWDREVERVEITEEEEVRGTVFHAEYLSLALRLCDAMLAETPLHSYRTTVIVGHGVGGAVAFCLSLLLHVRGFEVTNCVTFGSPKAVQQTLERYIHAINPVRVVLEGDPLIELPVTGDEGDPFVHYGEVLLMTPANKHEDEEENQQHDQKLRRRNVDEEAVGGDFSADVLGDILEMEASPVVQAVPGGRDDDDDDDDASEEEKEEDDTPMSLRIAAERYAAGFLAEHYIECFTDTTVPLTYAEGDEVWDEGDFAQMKHGAPLQLSVLGSQHWREDLKSPV